MKSELCGFPCSVSRKFDSPEDAFVRNEKYNIKDRHTLTKRITYYSESSTFYSELLRHQYCKILETFRIKVKNAAYAGIKEKI